MYVRGVIAKLIKEIRGEFPIQERFCEKYL